MLKDFPRFQSVGQNIRRLRKLRGITQQELADQLGISRQGIGMLEQSQIIEEEKLEKVATALGFTVEAVEHFSEEQSVIQIETMNDNASVYHYNSNPDNKVIELYEALLKSEREKNELLQKLLDKK